MLLDWEQSSFLQYGVADGDFWWLLKKRNFGIYIFFHSRYMHCKTPQIGLLNYAKCHFLWDDSKLAHNKVKTICIQPWVPPFSSHNYMVVIRTVKLLIPSTCLTKANLRICCTVTQLLLFLSFQQKSSSFSAGDSWVRGPACWKRHWKPFMSDHQDKKKTCKQVNNNRESSRLQCLQWNAR